ncbi:MAG: class I SAM-dependent methyltransferase [Bacteroidia bacterium]
MITSRDYYDEVAKKYHQIQESRLPYLLSAEQIVTGLMKEKKIIHYLDIGCGDATRSVRIINSINPQSAVLLDESTEMIRLASNHEKQNIKIVENNFLEYTSDESYDLITSMWNVFGHLESKEIKLKFLKKVYSLLSETGEFFFDVNNRYNVRYYGLKNVLKNFIRDVLTKEGSGNFYLNAKGSSSKVYIHHAYELDSLIRLTGFSKCIKIYIDYNTGKKTGSFISGQILYHLKK